MARLSAIFLALALSVSVRAADPHPDNCPSQIQILLERLPDWLIHSLYIELYFPMHTEETGFLISSSTPDPSEPTLIREAYINGMPYRWQFREDTKFMERGTKNWLQHFYIKAVIPLGVREPPQYSVSKLGNDSVLFQEALAGASEVLDIYEKRGTLTSQEVRKLRERQQTWEPSRFFFFRVVSGGERARSTYSALGVLDETPVPGIFVGPYRPPGQPGPGASQASYELVRAFNRLGQMHGPKLLTPWVSAVIAHRLGTEGRYLRDTILKAVAPDRQSRLYVNQFGFTDTDTAPPQEVTHLHQLEQAAGDYVSRFPPHPYLGRYFYYAMEFYFPD